MDPRSERMIFALAQSWHRPMGGGSTAWDTAVSLVGVRLLRARFCVGCVAVECD